MKNYEGMFLVDSRESKKGSGSIEELIQSLVTKCGGTMAGLANWDERKLAFEIKGATNGTYYLSYFTGDQDTVSKLFRECELSPVVLRALVLRIKEIPEVIGAREDEADREEGDLRPESKPRSESKPVEAEKGKEALRGPDANAVEADAPSVPQAGGEGDPEDEDGTPGDPEAEDR